jgi:hypothetical protein
MEAWYIYDPVKSGVTLNGFFFEGLLTQMPMQFMGIFNDSRKEIR